MDGYRVVAIAYREFPRDKTVFSVADETNLILLGYIAFFDPPKESAAKALEGLRQMGVSTKILTGDNALVTQKVCRDVGLAVEKVNDDTAVLAAVDDNTASITIWTLPLN